MRKEKAIQVLANGGYFIRQLETQYRGGEKFEYRLRDSEGNLIKGIGYSTFLELEKEFKLMWIESPKSSVYISRWILIK